MSDKSRSVSAGIPGPPGHDGRQGPTGASGRDGSVPLSEHPFNINKTYYKGDIVLSDGSKEGTVSVWMAKSGEFEANALPKRDSQNWKEYSASQGEPGRNGATGAHRLPDKDCKQDTTGQSPQPESNKRKLIAQEDRSVKPRTSEAPEAAKKESPRSCQVTTVSKKPPLERNPMYYELFAPDETEKDVKKKIHYFGSMEAEYPPYNKYTADDLSPPWCGELIWRFMRRQFHPSEGFNDKRDPKEDCSIFLKRLSQSLFNTEDYFGKLDAFFFTAMLYNMYESTVVWFRQYGNTCIYMCPNLDGGVKHLLLTYNRRYTFNGKPSAIDVRPGKVSASEQVIELDKMNFDEVTFDTDWAKPDDKNHLSKMFEALSRWQKHLFSNTVSQGGSPPRNVRNCSDDTQLSALSASPSAPSTSKSVDEAPSTTLLENKSKRHTCVVLEVDLKAHLDGLDGKGNENLRLYRDKTYPIRGRSQSIGDKTKMVKRDHAWEKQGRCVSLIKLTGYPDFVSHPGEDNKCFLNCPQNVKDGTKSTVKITDAFFQHCEGSGENKVKVKEELPKELRELKASVTFGTTKRRLSKPKDWHYFLNTAGTESPYESDEAQYNFLDQLVTIEAKKQGEKMPYEGKLTFEAKSYTKNIKRGVLKPVIKISGVLYEVLFKVYGEDRYFNGVTQPCTPHESAGSSKKVGTRSPEGFTSPPSSYARDRIETVERTPHGLRLDPAEADEEMEPFDLDGSSRQGCFTPNMLRYLEEINSDQSDMSGSRTVSSASFSETPSDDDFVGLLFKKQHTSSHGDLEDNEEDSKGDSKEDSDEPQDHLTKHKGDDDDDGDDFMGGGTPQRNKTRKPVSVSRRKTKKTTSESQGKKITSSKRTESVPSMDALPDNQDDLLRELQECRIREYKRKIEEKFCEHEIPIAEMCTRNYYNLDEDLREMKRNCSVDVVPDSVPGFLVISTESLNIVRKCLNDEESRTKFDCCDLVKQNKFLKKGAHFLKFLQALSPSTIYAFVLCSHHQEQSCVDDWQWMNKNVIKFMWNYLITDKIDKQVLEQHDIFGDFTEGRYQSIRRGRCEVCFNEGLKGRLSDEQFENKCAEKGYRNYDGPLGFLWRLFSQRNNCECCGQDLPIAKLKSKAEWVKWKARFQCTTGIVPRTSRTPDTKFLNLLSPPTSSPKQIIPPPASSSLFGEGDLLLTDLEEKTWEEIFLGVSPNDVRDSKPPTSPPKQIHPTQPSSKQALPMSCTFVRGAAVDGGLEDRRIFLGVSPNDVQDSRLLSKDAVPELVLGDPQCKCVYNICKCMQCSEKQSHSQYVLLNDENAMDIDDQIYLEPDQEVMMTEAGLCKYLTEELDQDSKYLTSTYNTEQ
jgi:hypothetical protein